MIQSVDRAIRVLTALQGSRRMTLTELATHLSLPASTVHGIVKTLVAHGMVVQERGSSRYQLGPAVLRLGNVYLDTIELRSKAIPWAEDLARRTGFAVRTGVLLLDDIVIIQHEPRPDGSRQMPEVGIVIPAHASALGKAILAFEASGELRCGNFDRDRAADACVAGFVDCSHAAGANARDDFIRAKFMAYGKRLRHGFGQKFRRRTVQNIAIRFLRQQNLQERKQREGAGKAEPDLDPLTLLVDPDGPGGLPAEWSAWSGSRPRR